MERIRILVVDDHPAVREGLAILISSQGMEVCAEAGTRIEQEIVLGIGGVRALRALGLRPADGRVQRLVAALEEEESLRVKNRIVMPPMGMGYAHEDGTVSGRVIEYYRARAAAGCTPDRRPAAAGPAPVLRLRGRRQSSVGSRRPRRGRGGDPARARRAARGRGAAALPPVYRYRARSVRRLVRPGRAAWHAFAG